MRDKIRIIHVNNSYPFAVVDAIDFKFAYHGLGHFKSEASLLIDEPLSAEEDRSIDRILEEQLANIAEVDRGDLVILATRDDDPLHSIRGMHFEICKRDKAWKMASELCDKEDDRLRNCIGNLVKKYKHAS